MMNKILNVKEVKIGRFIYEIKYVTNEDIYKIKNLEQDGAVYFGSCYYDKQIIYINKECSLERQLHTLWHEINHALVFQGSMFMSDEKNISSEERLVDTLATWMIELIKDNPKLIGITKRI